jgi:restriction system protein
MTQKEKDWQNAKTIPRNSGFGAWGPRRQMPALRLKRGNRSVRTLLLRGTAVFLLLVFATIFLHGNWPVALLWVSGGVGLWALFEERKRQRDRADMLSAVEAMGEDQFQSYTADLLRAQGYGVLKTAGLGSRHIDFLLTRGKGNCVCRLQRQTRQVCRSVVAEVLAGMEMYGCENAMIVTNQRFTLPARLLARQFGCVLIDRTGLANLVAQHRHGHRVLPFHREETARLRRRK